jgi:hypothetical protein
MNRTILNNMVANATITPLIGGGQVGAPVLNYGFNSLDAPDSNYDSIQLPEAIAGSIIIAYVIGSQNNILTVYPLLGSGNTINLTGTDATAFDFPNFDYSFPFIWSGQPLVFMCSFDGNWFINCASII